ncbi:mannose-6-phosphate isomerase, class I [Borrelia crocidurae]|uniref:mannose-6-phosphate isomerase, class I n=1 Tax=Borrelia crocidurae TaxID=29520 RepID=UPI00058BAA9B|nr:mannose-6-phosphate isomerase, class I [Borrelia crocidurae]
MSVDNIFLMKNEIKEYDWGGYGFIPSLLGQKEDGLPKAEMWLGAHKTFSSKILVDGQYVSLFNFLEIHKELLGFGNELSFLFKILSVHKPLSLQIHPSKDIALKGFALENNKKIVIDDSKRIYKDENPKVELVYALSDFYALKGFLPLDGINYIYRSLGLDFNFMTHESFVKTLFDLHEFEIENIIYKVLSNLNFIDEFRAFWFNEIYKMYGIDIGLLVFLGMYIFKLKTGEVFYTESREVHAYLKGECIELMTNSDNVIRAGFTTKHIDKDEMLKVGKFEEGVFSLLKSENIDGCDVFKLPGTNLSLFHKCIGGESYFERVGVMILLVIKGKVQLNNRISLKMGDSVFIGNCDCNKELSICGNGEIFIALSL